jgi:hypothetical protein
MPANPLGPKRQNKSLDVQLLTRIISKAGELELRQTLASSLATAASADVDALKRLLGPLVSATLNPLHCVRCHKSYVEQENTYRSCEIAHEEPDYLDDSGSSDYPCSEPDSEDSRGDSHEMMRYPCCGERIREDEADRRRAPCVSTKHTTDPRHVEYYVGEVVLPPKREGHLELNRHWDKYRGQNPKVITCQQKGCPRS